MTYAPPDNGPLFNLPPAQQHSPTSTAAAESVVGKAGTLRAAVLDFLRRGSGATDEEIQEGIPMAASTQRPRRVELVERGPVVDSGVTRATRSGRQAVVWRAT